MKIRETEKLKVQKQKRLKLNTRPCFKIPSSEFSNLGLAAGHGLWPSLSLTNGSQQLQQGILCSPVMQSTTVFPGSRAQIQFSISFLRTSGLMNIFSLQCFSFPLLHETPWRRGKYAGLFFHWEEFHSPPLPKKADMASKYFPLLFYL